MIKKKYFNPLFKLDVMFSILFYYAIAKIYSRLEKVFTHPSK